VLGKLIPMMERCESICDQVINIDPKIRYVVAATDNGKPIASRARDGLMPIMNGKDGEIVLTEAALITRMHREFDTQLGKVNYVLIEREKITIIIFSLGQDLLYVSCDLISNPSNLAEKIIQKIR
jgi:Family of unknown function (DUF6659)